MKASHALLMAGVFLLAFLTLAPFASASQYNYMNYGYGHGYSYPTYYPSYYQKVGCIGSYYCAKPSYGYQKQPSYGYYKQQPSYGYYKQPYYKAYGTSGYAGSRAQTVTRLRTVDYYQSTNYATTQGYRGYATSYGAYPQHVYTQPTYRYSYVARPVHYTYN